MPIIRELSDITDDLEELIFKDNFSETLRGFKFSENVHTIYMTNYNDFTEIEFPKSLQKLILQLYNENNSIINFICPPNLIELHLTHINIDNLIFPKSLQILGLYNIIGILDYDFNHELRIGTFVPINSPKFEFVQLDSHGYHYIYLKWPRDHFIKAANN
jgi:hypothetical protein